MVIASARFEGVVRACFFFSSSDIFKLLKKESQKISPNAKIYVITRTSKLISPKNRTSKSIIQHYTFYIVIRTIGSLAMLISSNYYITNSLLNISPFYLKFSPFFQYFIRFSRKQSVVFIIPPPLLCLQGRNFCLYTR